MNGPIGYGTGLVLGPRDAQDADHPVRPLLELGAPPFDKAWDFVNARINQGQTNKCVGASTGQELGASPVKIPISHPHTMDNIYALAQKLDEIPGENYEGSTLTGGMKAAREFGYIDGWKHAENVDELVLALCQLGPVLLAGPWLSGMFQPDATGRLRVSGTSGTIGHMYTLGELRWAAGDVVIEQTWGPSWSRLPGVDGGWRAVISIQDVAQLLRMGTQAAIILGRKDPAAPAPPPPGPTPPPAPLERLTTSIDVYSTGRVQVRPIAQGVELRRDESGPGYAYLNPSH